MHHNLLVRIHFIIVMIRWTDLAPWEFEFPFPGSHTLQASAQVNRWCNHARARVGISLNYTIYESSCMDSFRKRHVSSVLLEYSDQGPFAIFYRCFELYQKLKKHFKLDGVIN